ncbi:MAG: Methionyl-tRNA synthetase [Candidatus Parcubacteria bacterium]|jgi:methionyl-tRNA synthetase
MSETENTTYIEYEDFKKVQIQVGEIIGAEPVEGSEKLLKLKVKFGEEERQILSGIAKFISPEQLVGMKVPFVTNLKPRMMMGLESNGMILAAIDSEQNFSLLETDSKVASGTHVS